MSPRGRGRPRGRRPGAGKPSARPGGGAKGAPGTGDPRYRRILKVLDLARLGRGWTRRELERALGRGKGYLKRVADGPGELRVTDLLRAVDVLGLAPEAVFGPLVLGTAPAPARRPAPPLPPAPAGARGGATPTLRELEALVDRLVDQRLTATLFEALDAAAAEGSGRGADALPDPADPESS